MNSLYRSYGDDERQVLGISLTKAMAREVKVEAARRGLTLRALFEEMWQAYSREEREAPQTKSGENA